MTKPHNIPVAPEDREYLEAQLEKLSGFLEEINFFKSLPVRLRTELREHGRWIKAGIRQADGLEIHTRHLRNDLPTEEMLIRRALNSAAGVGALIDECSQRAPKNGRTEA
jgi:hypothetical protein